MDALTFLWGEHQTVLGGIALLERAPCASEARSSDLDTMVKELIVAESRREAIEEQLFWPAVRDELDDGDELAEQVIAQQRAAKKLLQRLEDRDPAEPAFEELLSEFAAVAREHIWYEQDVVWPRFAAAVGEDEQRRLGLRLQEAREIAAHRSSSG